MLITVEHVTTYRFDRPVRGVVQSHRLTPSVFEGQRTLAWDVAVSDGQKGGGFRDGAGDWVQGWTVSGPVEEIAVTVRGLVETADMAGVLRGHRESVHPLAWLSDTGATRPDAAIRDLAAGVRGAGGALDTAHALSAAVGKSIVWTPGATRAHTTAAEALTLGEGVCQDHAHVMIAAARVLALPARYVAGYMLADDATGEAAHAWAEVWVEGLGWVGFDPANECCPDARYIRTGSGLDARDAAPIRGITRGGAGAETLAVAVRVALGQGQAQVQQ
ncbi:MAG TPA: transglutaminase family protein [Paracoccaceae bacterium]|nr:transglutaminase family protein [Paracoccaceae bacterium]HMO72693.1 transglutaminase family protein [Paracoccaceae bacterium]